MKRAKFSENPRPYLNNMAKEKKKLEDMTAEELIQELRKSQGPGDCLMEIGPKGVRMTVGKEKQKKIK